MTETARIPLFPLNTVLFPGGRRCMREQSAFGVVLVRSGGEVGEVAGTAEVGTTARIVDFDQLPDGLLGITCLGERKFRVITRWREADGLNMAQVQWLAVEPEVETPPEYRHLADILRKVLPELAEMYQFVDKKFDQAAWVGARLTELVPLELTEKQVILEMTDPVDRLARLAPMIKRSEDD
jgi:uncharacterized protein